MTTCFFDDAALAADLLRQGGLVAFPTETVYGLGADARNEQAVARIFAAKERPATNPLIVHLPERDPIELVAARVPDVAEKLMDAFFPGMLTLVLPRHPDLPASVSAGLPTVGVRVPELALAREFLQACGVPVAAPSANRSGRPSPTTWQAVATDLEGRIEGILQGPQARTGLESTVVDCTGDVPVLLRPGALSLEALQAVVPETRLPGDHDDLLQRSPGTRFRHYAPLGKVVFDPAEAQEKPIAWIGVSAPPHDLPVSFLQGCVGAEGYAYELYHFFRRCDSLGIKTIVCERVPDTGIGRALNDRLNRAAEARTTPA